MKRKANWLIASNILLIIMYVGIVIIFLVEITPMDTKQRILMFSIMIAIFTLWFMCNIVLFAFYLLKIKKIKKNEIDKQEGINNLVSSILNKNKIGVIIFNYLDDIIWENKYIFHILGHSVIGLKYFDAFKMFKDSDLVEYWTELGEVTYLVKMMRDEKAILFFERSKELAMTKNIEDKKIAFGEIEIDNIKYLNETLNEEQIIEINTFISNYLNEQAELHKFLIQKYANGKFSLILYKDMLDKMIKNNFDIFSNISNINQNNTLKNITITFSVGIAWGYDNLNKLQENAITSLSLSKNRGGNQITLSSRNEKSRYFGDQNRIDYIESKSKIQLFANRFKNIIDSKEVEEVFIYGHNNADLDSIGSAIGLHYIIKTFTNKKAFIVLDTTDKTGEKVLKNIKNSNPVIFEEIISSKKAKKAFSNNSIVFLVDVHDPDRTDSNAFLKKTLRKNIFAIDHHRASNKITIFDELNLFIDTYASSTSEIIVDIFNALSKTETMPVVVAQALLDGIYTDTNRFTKNVSSNTFSACSLLQRNGANTTYSENLIKHSEEVENDLKQLLDNTSEVRKGYFLSYVDKVVSSDTISIAANRLLQVSGRKASFVIAKLVDGSCKLSIRSAGENIQIIAESLGGGGQYDSAAVVSKEPMNIFVDNVIQAIASYKEK
ncbi:DHH family phosphoesterase [Mycoplasma phocimorsus]|uniref:DHH family phosphoesterase n=1 Tax=Mycoplasma phocimorsus TaxID=3045839 RepID=UPI0024BFA8B6|nr:DHH family phosphoesterase [Mycoplasma phocimorsus]MDJ1648706.1 DHH family phosphoesterase [Mycoplasma phocimorsus]